MFFWLEYSPLTDKAFCFVCRSFYDIEEKTMQKIYLHSMGFSNGRKLEKYLRIMRRVTHIEKETLNSIL